MRALERVWWLPAVAVTAFAAWLDRNVWDGDLLYFVHRGEVLVSSAWRDTYGDVDLQAGPLQLLVLGGGGRVASLVGASPSALLAFTVELGVIALFLAAAWLVVREAAGRPRPLIAGAAGLAAASVGYVHGAYVDGHPAQAVAPLLWALAALCARHGRLVPAGALIGLASGFETWGVLGVPVLLLASDRRRIVAGVVAVAVTVATLYAPLAILGEFRMLEYEWQIQSETLLGLVFGLGTPFGWPLRLLQAAAAVGAGSYLALRLRHNVHAVWLVPLVTVAVRLALDPIRFSWYWLAPQTFILLGVAALAASGALAILGASRQPARGPSR